jgi:hypothetical protein
MLNHCDIAIREAIEHAETPDPRNVPDAALCYPPHLDDDWRLCSRATNAWMGTIEDRTGEEIMDLTEWAVIDFAAAFLFAQATVIAHNALRFGIRLNDYPLLPAL